MNDQKNRYDEFALGFGKANFYAFMLNIPIIIILFVLFKMIWGIDILSSEFDTIKNHFLFVLVGGVIIHELLHGLTWALFTSQGLKSIRFRFKWKYLTPYCHCKEALKVKQYKLGIFMPLGILGISPFTYAIIVGNPVIFFYGVLFTALASGDIIVLYFLRKYNSNCYIIDHPTKMGFYVNCEE